jgi:tetratricopeptide (TPR) repeat protein
MPSVNKYLTAVLAMAVASTLGSSGLPRASAQPATAPALDDPTALPGLDFTQDLTKKKLPVIPGPWQQLVNQPYFKDNLPLKADRLLFHGQYEDAEILCNELLAKKDLPDDKRQAITEIRLEAIFRQGGDSNIHRFQTQSAQLTSPHMILLRAQAMLQGGKLADALAFLKAFVDAHKDLALDANTFAVFNLYGQSLERMAQYGDAVFVYSKVAAFSVQDMPEDPYLRTEVAKAVLRAAILSDQGDGSSKRARLSALAAFNAIISMDSTYWPAQVEMTRLLFATQNLRDGDASASIVMGFQPYNTEVRFMILSELINQSDFTRSTKLIAELKTIDDSAMVDAYEGRLMIKQHLLEEAVAPLRRALAKDPSLLEAHGWLAGLYFLRNDPDKGQQELDAAKTADRTPHPIALYEAAGVLAENSQYPQAQKLLQQATSQAGWWSAPYIALANVDLQAGYLDQAQTAFDKGFALDDYGMKTVNQLRLLQLLKSRDVLETPHFIIRYQGPARPDPEHPDAPLPAQTSDRVLAELVGAWCEKIYPEVTSDFQFEPREKTSIEVYPAHEEFAVRIAGITQVNTDIVGVSIGRSIALDAPRPGKDLLGNLDWARVIRHEFTHTVTTSLTLNRIPRWLTEAAAVHEEQAPRDWDMCRLLAASYTAGTLFKFEDLTKGFVYPKRATDIALAYAESEWIYEYLTTTYGHDKMLDFMHGFRDGKTEAEAFQSAYGKPSATINGDFLKWAGEQIAVWGLPNTVLPTLAAAQAAAAKDPADAKAQRILLNALLANNKIADAEKMVRALLEKTPDDLDLRQGLVEILVATNKPDAARPLLEKLAADAPDRPAVARLMGQAAMTAKNYDDAVKWFEKLEQLRPLDDTPYRSLAGIYLSRKDNQNAILQLERIVPHEKADERIPRRLAQLLLDDKRLKEAADCAFRSIRIDPYNAINHQLMAKILLAEGQPKDAVTYLTYATALEPETAEFWTNLAEADAAAGDQPAAAAAAKKAIELDPKAPVKNWLR